MKNVQKRRDFLRISAAGALGVAALGPMACKPGAKKTTQAEPVDRKSFGVGLQLYSIRDAMGQPVLTLSQSNAVPETWVWTGLNQDGKNKEK